MERKRNHNMPRVWWVRWSDKSIDTYKSGSRQEVVGEMEKRKKEKGMEYEIVD